MSNQESPSQSPKEEGAACVKAFEDHVGKVVAVVERMCIELNSRPLVLIPVMFKESGNGFVLAFHIGDNKYCPVARVMSTKAIKDVIASVELEGEYTLVSQAEVEGFKEFNAGELWMKS